ncbi:hypothetical protein FCV43_11475 [Vibrio genomosp. F6]|uniref:spondin domain-containing protein n=1 Tax=Vibrio genomosp. F6 TaxID=723172 RepID=UPI0010BD6D6F|nr:spondin domain-containing protein [Vibrio genomosp. F6]TKF21026.1 hypothetical protein FCV43_11475 [Vibrio genomosp. F6]
MKYRILILAASVGLLAGCPDDSDKDLIQTFTITVENQTANQPMSPLVVLGHNSDYHLFNIGQASSVALEMLAESGDNSMLLDRVNTNSDVYQAKAGAGLILPGASDTVSITLNPYQSSHLSLASMLVNTNDAFVGETDLKTTGFSVGQRYTMSMDVWDSGTEANSETAATVPGPAGGGEGFNSARDDNDIVTFHSGVISQDDGLAASALNATHRFLNPGAKLIITRVK